MLGDSNTATINTGVAANLAGVTYAVRFEAAAAVFRAPSQAAGSDELLSFDVLSSADNVVASFDYLMPAWIGAASNPFQRASFNYIGDRTGNIHLRIPDVQNDGRVAGAFDNVSISAGPEPTTPVPTAMGLGLGGLATGSCRAG